MNRRFGILVVSLMIICLCIGLINISDVNAVSYYNWIQNPSFEGNINLIDDSSFESGLCNSGLIYGNWSNHSGTVLYTTSVKHTGVYSVYIDADVFWYNLTNPVLGGDINNFTFWAMNPNSYAYRWELTIYYTDFSTDTTTDNWTSIGVWQQFDLLSLIDDSKYITCLEFKEDTTVDQFYLDDVELIISDIDGQTEVTATTTPWKNLNFLSDVWSWFDIESDISTEQYYTGTQSYEFVEDSSFPIYQQINYLDSDLVHFGDLMIKTNDTDGVLISYVISYTDGRYSQKNVTVPYDSGNWQHIVFSGFVYEDAYINGIMIICYDNEATISTFIDDVGLWCSVPTDWKRFDYSLSPIPISKGYSSFNVYQKTTYYLTVNIYDVNQTKSENGAYQLSDEFGVKSGSFTDGEFTVTLNQRVHSSEDIEDTIIILVTVSGELITLELNARWEFISEGGTGEGTANNLLDWIVMFCVIFIPALLFSGALYENNQEPDALHINPVFGVMGGLVLSVGIGVYTNLIPLWMLIAIIISIVVLIVGLVRS